MKLLFFLHQAIIIGIKLTAQISILATSKLVAPVRQLIGAPLAFTTVLVSVGSVAAALTDLLADWIIGIFLTIAHLLAQYGMHRANQAHNQRVSLQLSLIIGLYTIVLVLGMLFSLWSGLIGVWSLCCLVMVIHLLLAHHIPHS